MTNPTEVGLYLLIMKDPRTEKEMPKPRLASWNGQAWESVSTLDIGDAKTVPKDFKDYILFWKGPLMVQDRMHARDRVMLATRTESPVNEEMLKRFANPEAIRILHAVMGLCTEVAGEMMDNLKKHFFYGKPLDKLNMMEEMGDCDWYLNLACDVLHTTMAIIEVANVKKLAARYGEKFSQDKALIRNLTNEMDVLESNLAPLELVDPMLDERNKQHQSPG